ncbi:MAG: two-component system cell cycle sensor histidine kinase/response regulator CckA [Kiritimatiellia bacterium]
MVAWNPAATRVFGYSSAEAIGAHVLELIVPSDVHGLVEEIWARLLNDVGGGRSTNANMTKDGRRIQCEWYNTPLVDVDGRVIGVSSLGMDVTTKHQASESLQISQARYEAAQQLANIANLDCASPGADLVGCAQLNRLLGFEPGRACNLDLVLACTHSEDRGRLRAALADAWSGSRRVNADFRVVRVDATVHWLRMTVQLTHDGGRVPNQARLIGFVQDYSERHAERTARRNLETQFLHAQKLESLGVLAGGIAHDFNNLLVAMVGNAELALSGLPDTSDSFEHIRDVLVAARRAGELTNQMLAYAGRGDFVVEYVDLNHIVAEMAQILDVSISKMVQLQQELAPGLPAIRADASQIRQIVLNLLTNASEAIGEQPGAITLRTGLLTTNARYMSTCVIEAPVGDYIYVEVIDTGYGMDHETQARLFEPFFTTKFTGCGLGMAAVQGIVRQHGGTLKLKSKPGVGTRFQVLFPVGDQPSEAVTSLPPSRPQESVQIRGTVLVVDDEPLVLRTIKSILERAGLCVLTAQDGVEALKVHATMRDQIDMMLLDLTMPKMSGEEVYAQLQAEGHLPKVVLMSGYTKIDVASRFSGKGFCGLLHKPFSVRELLGAVEAALKVS